MKLPKLLEVFKMLTPAQAVALELKEAEFALLRAETGVEYAQALVVYNRNRIKRLKAHLTNTEEVA